MNRTVGEHVTCLKSRIDVLTGLLDGKRTQEERKKFQAEIGIAYLALAHYEAALKEENKLSALQGESAA